MRRPLLIGVAVALALALAFYGLAGVIDRSPAVVAFDTGLATAIHSLRTPWLTAFMRFITTMGDTLAVTTMTLTLMAVMWLRDHRRRAWYIGVVGAVGASLSGLFKEVFARARPPLDSAIIVLPASFSFPSGHTMASLCFGWAVAYVSARSDRAPALKAALVALAALYAASVAFSRVYLGAHWPSDVVASWLLGGAWIALATGIYEWARLRRRAGSAA